MFSRSKSDVSMTSVGEFSSTRAEATFSAIVDGDVHTGERNIANSQIDSDNYCLFVDGGWNCAGEECSNRSHHLS
jgi:hypothetical protein